MYHHEECFSTLSPLHLVYSVYLTLSQCFLADTNRGSKITSKTLSVTQEEARALTKCHVSGLRKLPVLPSEPDTQCRHDVLSLLERSLCVASCHTVSVTALPCHRVNSRKHQWQRNTNSSCSRPSVARVCAQVALRHTCVFGRFSSKLQTSASTPYHALNEEHVNKRTFVLPPSILFRSAAGPQPFSAKGCSVGKAEHACGLTCFLS